MTPLTPQPMATPDLAGILKRPTRAPRPTPPVPTDNDQLTDGPSLDAPMLTAPVGQRVSPPPPREPVRRTTSRPAATSTEPTARAGERQPPRSYLRAITVYLPRSTFERLSAEAVRRNLSRTALMLMSVNETHTRLPELLAQEPAPRGALFDVPQARAPKLEPDTQTSLRVTDQQLAVLEALAAEHQTNRSKVLAAAVDVFLS